MPCQPTEVHVISHFHWDREWYQPFQDYRRRLVTAMDELLDILARDPAYRHFWLDGQTIVLEDYLEIRPEREMELRTYLASGRIAAGPWYVQPDEALVSGEALIRNLLMGHRLARAYGGTVPKVGYVPDIFGHISQLPQILRGFGIDNALLWRGVESEGMPSELAWEGADGSHVLLVRFPENWGYSAWHHRVRIPHIADPLDEHKLVEAVRGFLAYKAERATTPVIIAMDGTDHAEPDPRLPEWLALLQERIPGVQFIHSTPMAFLERLRPWVHKPAPVNGELRHPSQSARTANWLLNGVLSSRIHLKQRNTLCQTLLERWAEPFAALAHVHAGVPYPRSYLRLAWKHLLQNHPHDSICGCSVDQVHQDMLYRFDQARLIADATTAEALRHLTDDVGVAEGTPGAQLLTIYNPAPAPFAGTVLVDLEVPAAPLVKQRALHDPVRHFMHVFDAEGQPVPAQICALHPQEERPVRRGPGHWPWETVDRYRVAMHAHVPACGYATYTYERREEPLRRAGSMAAGPRTWEGRSLRLSVNGDGSLNLLDKETGVEYRDLLVWEDVGDVGDGWMHFSPLCDRRVTSVGACATVSAECEGPLFTRLRLDWRLRVPACAPDERERSREEVDLPITAWLDFPYDARQIAVRVRVDNVARDHALRVLFPSGRSTDHFYTDAAFDVVRRPVHRPRLHEGNETTDEMVPQQGLVAVHDNEAGLAILSKGLPAVNVRPDSARTIALTLLRAFQKVILTPGDGGQIQGPHEFSFALLPFRPQPGWEAALVRQADPFRSGLRTHCRPACVGSGPRSRSLLQIEPEALQLSAFKASEEEEGLFVLRLYNPTHEPVQGVVRFARPPIACWLATLAEERGKPVPLLEDEAIPVQAGPKKIVTLLLSWSASRDRP